VAKLKERVAFTVVVVVPVLFNFIVRPDFDTVTVYLAMCCLTGLWALWTF
jgi:hypothetical protein